MRYNYYVQDDWDCTGWHDKEDAVWQASLKSWPEGVWRGFWRIKEWKEKA